MQQAVSKFVIRPFEVKHLFDLAIKLYRSNFSVLFLTQAMVQLPLSLLALAPMLKFVDMLGQVSEFQTTGREPDVNFLYDNLDALIWIAAALLGAAAYQLLITPIGNVSCAYAAREALTGRVVSFAEAVRFALTRYWPTQVALAGFFLPLLALAVLVLIPVLLLQGLGTEGELIAASLFGLFLIMLASIATMLLWFRFFPALTGIIQSAEDPPPGSVFSQGVHYLRRSYELTQGYFARVLGLSVLIYFAVYLVNRGIVESIQLLVIVAQALFRGQNAGQELVRVAMAPADPLTTGITMAAASVVGLIFPALVMCYLVLLYYDLRCRKEAYDLKRELGLPQP